MLKPYLLFVFLLFIVSGTAQETMFDKEFKKIQAAYLNKEFLSYNVQYLYARENAPDNYIDTVNGTYKINKNLYWGRLDNVEYLQTDSLFISVYEEDKVILVNSNAPAWLQPSANWDSLYKKGVKTSLVQQGNLNMITMNYPGDSLYKKVVFWYSRQDYLVKKMLYVVRQSEEFKDEGAEQSEFVNIEIRFSDFNFERFDRSLFGESLYIEKRQKEYLPSKKYIDYTVLVGSPGLLN
jgi:hypothetical protein